MPLLSENKDYQSRNNKPHLQKDWFAVRRLVQNTFGKRPDINAMLFLIGMNEVGITKETFTKEEKQDLMHVAMCTLMLKDGYYIKAKPDEDGWPHFKQVKELPPLKLREQESWLKEHIVWYFKNKNYV